MCDPTAALKFAVKFKELNDRRNLHARMDETVQASKLWKRVILAESVLPRNAVTESLVFMMSAKAHIEGDLKDAAKATIIERLEDMKLEAPGRPYSVLGFVHDFIAVETMFAEVTLKTFEWQERQFPGQTFANRTVQKWMKQKMDALNVFDVIQKRNEQLGQALYELHRDGILKDENFNFRKHNGAVERHTVHDIVLALSSKNFGEISAKLGIDSELAHWYGVGTGAGAGAGEMWTPKERLGTERPGTPFPFDK